MRPHLVVRIQGSAQLHATRIASNSACTATSSLAPCSNPKESEDRSVVTEEFSSYKKKIVLCCVRTRIGVSYQGICDISE